MYRDKMYLRTSDDLLFNVTGYRHPDESAYGSLKYIGSKKWTHGYVAAIQYLAEHHPEYVDADQFIRVPNNRIAEVFDPQVRWMELLSSNIRSSLLGEAVELGSRFREAFAIPPSTSTKIDTEFGITDSLLWGEGHAESDIDLVVVGRENIARVIRWLPTIYEQPDFQRPDPEVMKAPYGHSIENWPDVLARRWQMGSWRGRLFSLRGMLSVEEVDALPQERVIVRDDVPHPLEFRIADDTDAVLFPAIWRDEKGNELVDWSVVYEGVFRTGDVVRCHASHEVVRSAGREFDRYVLTHPVTWS